MPQLVGDRPIVMKVEVLAAVQPRLSFRCTFFLLAFGVGHAVSGALFLFERLGVRFLA